MKKRFTIIQILRLGDLLQTKQACDLFKEKYPEIELTLICRKTYGGPLKELLEKTFVNIHYLDLKELISPKTGFIEAKVNLETFVKKINKTKTDAVLNFSFSKSSEYLMSLIETENKIGPFRNKQNEITINDVWGQYVYANILNNKSNPLHLVDLYQLMLAGELPNKDPEIPLRLGTKIIVHPFASNKKKSWPLGNWAMLINTLAMSFDEVEIEVVGAKGESDQADILFSSLTPTTKERSKNLVGKTNINELIERFDNACLFIGHDSMVSHLASLKKIQTLTLSLGPVRPTETMPYGSLNYTLMSRWDCQPCFVQDDCHTFECHTIPVKDVVHYTFELLENGVVEHVPKETQTQVLVSHIHPELGQKAELIDETFSETGYTYRTKILDIIYSYLLRGLEIERPIGQIDPNLKQVLKSELIQYERVFELITFGERFSTFLYQEVKKEERNPQVIKEYLQKTNEVIQLIEQMAKTSELLKPLSDFVQLKLSLETSNTQINELAPYFYESFKYLGAAVKILFELTQKTVKEDLIVGQDV